MERWLNSPDPCPCGVGPPHTPENCPAEVGEPEQVWAGQLIDALQDRMPGLHVDCEQTGGGVATLYGWEGDERPQYEQGQRYALCIGPGTYSWGDARLSTFWTGEGLYVGPDDDGEAQPARCATLAEAIDAAEVWVQASRAAAE